ncbi:ATP-dependent 6-phosphofructokinase [Desulfovibrio litoralis]|uniref:6-phosphofructokinase n=1 Tax=Desulfovibrio litoralis DSM 11393 TaxID=1121455 RepID=A0A1M7SY48_9BACT|nr:ATP-dependent 6-phosphofructokinase [Desulfovibrio litoralis]SHN63308.1 6-phosphofructokinase [Desulfovibrio litoralis DSM 11393]
MSSTKVKIGNFEIDTNIQTLGQAKIPSSLNYCHFQDEARVSVFLDGEHVEELGDEVVAASFEAAGPRMQLYFDSSKTKCAIATCGGLCPGINNVIRSIVMEAYHNYNVPAVLGFQYGLEGFIPHYGHKVVELTPDNVSDIHQFGGTILGSSRGPQPPEEIVDALERSNVSILFMIGGDGTMKATHNIVKEIERRNLKISVIGIPKTIDNDINFISQSFGFETAVYKATEAIQCAHIEATGAMNGIGIVKLMGRDSGFIAAHATLSLKEVNLVLIPEINFRLNGEGGILPALAERLNKRKHAVIVVAEGAGQHIIGRGSETDASGNVALGDFTEFLIKEIKKYMKEHKITHSIKYIDPSYIIRSIPATANDSVYCGFLGTNAVHAAMAGKTNMVVAKIMDRYVHLPLELIIRKRRTLNTKSEYWRAVLESTGQEGLYGMIPELDGPVCS